MEWWPWFREELNIYEMAEEGKTSLYVSDLEPSLTDSDLFEAFWHARESCELFSILQRFDPHEISWLWLWLRYL